MRRMSNLLASALVRLAITAFGLYRAQQPHAQTRISRRAWTRTARGVLLNHSEDLRHESFGSSARLDRRCRFALRVCRVRPAGAGHCNRYGGTSLFDKAKCLVSRLGLGLPRLGLGLSWLGLSRLGPPLGLLSRLGTRMVLLSPLLVWTTVVKPASPRVRMRV